MWWPVLLVEETGIPGKNHWPAAGHRQTLSHNFMSGIGILVVIGTDCIWFYWPLRYNWNIVESGFKTNKKQNLKLTWRDNTSFIHYIRYSVHIVNIDNYWQTPKCHFKLDAAFSSEHMSSNLPPIFYKKNMKCINR